MVFPERKRLHNACLCESARRALEAEGRDGEAMEEYRAAISHDPVVVEAFYSLGLLYRRHERGAEAEAAFAEYKKRKAGGVQ